MTEWEGWNPDFVKGFEFGESLFAKMFSEPFNKPNVIKKGAYHPRFYDGLAESRISFHMDHNVYIVWVCDSDGNLELTMRNSAMSCKMEQV